MIAALVTPWVDLTRWSIEWTRNWLEWTEHVCDEIEESL